MVGCVPSKKTVTTVIVTLDKLIFYLKSSKTMRYNIMKASAPKMPRLGKGK